MTDFITFWPTKAKAEAIRRKIASDDNDDAPFRYRVEWRPRGWVIVVSDEEGDLGLL
jgi:hypothetical protein